MSRKGLKTHWEISAFCDPERISGIQSTTDSDKHNTNSLCDLFSHTEDELISFDDSAIIARWKRSC